MQDNEILIIAQINRNFLPSQTSIRGKSNYNFGKNFLDFNELPLP